MASVLNTPAGSKQVQPNWAKHGYKVSHVKGILCRLISSQEHSASPRAPLLGELRGLLALGIHGVYCHGCLKVVAVMEGRVV